MAERHPMGCLKWQVKCRRSKGRLKHGGVGFQPNSATRGLGSYIYIFKVTLTNMGTHDKKR